jgi:hypothetical protein
MTVLPFAQQSYRAYETQPGPPLPSLLFEDSATGDFRSIGYSEIRAIVFQRGDHIAILNSDYAVVLEGTHLMHLAQALADRSVTEIRTFCAEAFAPPASGAPSIDRVQFITRDAAMSVGSFLHQWLRTPDEPLPYHLC